MSASWERGRENEGKGGEEAVNQTIVLLILSGPYWLPSSELCVLVQYTVVPVCVCVSLRRSFIQPLFSFSRTSLSLSRQLPSCHFMGQSEKKQFLSFLLFPFSRLLPCNCHRDGTHGTQLSCAESRMTDSLICLSLTLPLFLDCSTLYFCLFLLFLPEPTIPIPFFTLLCGTSCYLPYNAAFAAAGSIFLLAHISGWTRE